MWHDVGMSNECQESHSCVGEVSFYLSIYLSPRLRICVLILKREEEGERERNIDWLPPVYTPNPQLFGVWDGAPTEPPGQSQSVIYF